MPKAAVTITFGPFEFVRMPFGLGNTAQIFQKFVHEVTRGLENMYMYLDDIPVASHPEEQNSAQLRALSDLLRKHGSTIDASKCELGKPTITV